MYFDYFDTQTINNTEVVDIWKQIDLSKELDTTDYIFHTLNEQENLMDLSFMYYGTINDWWCIYLFNKLYDVNFCILMTSTIKNTQARYVYDVQHYLDITKTRKQYIEYLIRQFYLKENTLENAIELTNQRLSSVEQRNDADFLEPFKIFIYEELINSSTYRIQIKIPSSSIVYSIKNALEKYNLIWKN